MTGRHLDVGSIGPLTPADIPLSAIDFHVSSIVEELLNDAEVAAKATVRSCTRPPLQVPAEKHAHMTCCAGTRWGCSCQTQERNVAV